MLSIKRINLFIIVVTSAGEFEYDVLRLHTKSGHRVAVKRHPKKNKNKINEKKTLKKLELRKKHVVFFLFFYPSYEFEKKCQKRPFW